MLFPTDTREVVNVIRSLKNKGSVMHDISVRCIKNNLGIFAEQLSRLYNFSIEKESYPEALKIATVVPGYKSGAKDDIDNFRPISNLPVFSKVFERLTLTRFSSFAYTYSLIHENQFGFQKGKSITQAAIKLTTLITRAYHCKHYAACFFLDLKKAFDTVDHDILLSKLNHMGFRGTSNQYMASYLKNRKQCTQVGSFKSDLLTITKGVPQGSILGPFLFCLYINDIFDAVDIDAVVFADDGAFFVSSPKLQLLYDQIEKLFGDLSVYLNNSKLTPNLRKSKLMFFSSRPTPVEGLQSLLFRNVEIEWVSEYRYLGLNLTNKLNYSQHIDRISNRISQYVGVFYHLNKILPLNVLILLYHSLVVPHLTLHAEIWGSAQETYVNKLIVKQNKVLRAILGVALVDGRPVMRTAEMYRGQKVLTFKNIFKLQLFKFLLSVLKGDLPLFYNLILRPLHSLNVYFTRGGEFRLPFVTCEVERRGIAYQMVSLLNNIEIELYISLPLRTAVKRYKRFLLASQ